jgi:hypothetical protein
MDHFDRSDQFVGVIPGYLPPLSAVISEGRVVLTVQSASRGTLSIPADFDSVQQNTMPKLNPALFDPLTRIENACRRASGIMLTAPNLVPRETDLVTKEVREIDDALAAFKAAVEAGEMPRFQSGSLRSHGTS